MAVQGWRWRLARLGIWSSEGRCLASSVIREVTLKLLDRMAEI